jgi:hypothetical protein
MIRKRRIKTKVFVRSVVKKMFSSRVLHFCPSLTNRSPPAPLMPAPNQTTNRTPAVAAADCPHPGRDATTR